MTKKNKPVFSREMAQMLTWQGFKVVDVVPNNNKPWLNVYYFKPTPEFLDAFDKIISTKKT